MSCSPRHRAGLSVHISPTSIKFSNPTPHNRKVPDPDIHTADADGKARTWTQRQMATALARLKNTGSFCADGIALDRDALAQILSSAPRTDDGRPCFDSSTWRGTTFPDEASFDKAAFGADTSFEGATFGKLVDFAGTTFGPRLDFRNATFGSSARFREATIGDNADFRWATFERDADFHGATFGTHACLKAIDFGYSANFSEASFGSRLELESRFESNADFRGAKFGDNNSVRSSFKYMAHFDQASFGSDCNMRYSHFDGQSDFTRATFGDRFHFGDATLGPDLTFVGARFGESVQFTKTTFDRGADFTDSRFEDGADFRDTTFAAQPVFIRTRFGGGASFKSAGFGPDSAFHGAALGAECDFGACVFDVGSSFQNAHFGERAEFGGAEFRGDAVFDGSVFGSGASFGPLVVHGCLKVNRSRFDEVARFDVAATWVDASSARFHSGGILRVRWAQVDLSGAVFTQRTTLSMLSAPIEAEHLDFDPSPASDPTPRVVSLRGADVGFLTVSQVDMAICRFLGAHNLEGLRLEGAPQLAHAPTWLGQQGRLAIAEEHQWRAECRTRGWSDVVPIAPPATFDLSLVPLVRLASIYRSLRKGREDIKDAPGAADFYYGEMEMRRLSLSSLADRLVLFAYWLLSGYGLRTSRALVWFGIVVLIFSLAFWLIGLSKFPGWTINGWLLGLQTSVLSASSLLRPAPEGLSAVGQVLDAILRVAGTGLLGLAVFSLRGRIRR